MKLTKFTILAAAATLVLGISSARAAIGISTNNSRLNISGTVTTNAPSKTSGNTYTSPVKTVKYGNKQLLDLFAGWDGTTWPKGAKLVIGWDSPWNGDVLVVDKTGTNVLFDATSGVGSYPTYAYFSVDFWDEYGAGATKSKTGDPGFEQVNATGTAYYTLYDNYGDIPYTNLYGNGGTKQSFKQSWDKNGNYTNWKDNEMAKFLYSGDQYFFNSISDTTTTANIKANGSGKGENYVGWAGR